MPPEKKHARGSGNPDPVDIHVGSRLRLLRSRSGLSQEGLAAKIDLTFQQIQKYERGANRISASKLYYIACALGVEIPDFYKHLDTKNLPAIEPSTPAPASWNAYYSKLSAHYLKLAISTINHFIELSEKTP